MKTIINILVLLFVTSLWGQSALDILNKSDKNFRGNTSYAEITIQIIRPKWQREMRLKNWSKGDDYAVSLITYPAKEKGIVFLKRKNEMWNYVPSIDRRIKMPPSMMLQSWMGTDLTNDDLVKQSSIVRDYTARIVGEEKINGLNTWKIELIPKEEAPVVWGKLLIWIDRQDYMQIQAEFYDEDNFLVNKMTASKPKRFGNRKLPSEVSFIPVDKTGYKTVIIYNKLVFDKPIQEKYFSVNYMKRLRK